MGSVPSQVSQHMAARLGLAAPPLGRTHMALGSGTRSTQGGTGEALGALLGELPPGPAGKLRAEIVRAPSGHSERGPGGRVPAGLGSQQLLCVVLGAAEHSLTGCRVFP